MIQAINIPQSIETEQAIIGKLLEDNSILSEVEILKPEDFYLENHQLIYRAILEQDGFDIVTTADKLKSYGKLDDIGGIGTLAELEAAAPMQGNFEYYAKIVKENSLLRDLISGCNGIIRECIDPEKDAQSVLIDAEKLLTELSKQSIVKSSVGVKESAAEYFLDLEERAEQKKTIIGAPTGFIKLDALTSGLIAPDLITIAAASGIGKTAFALNILSYVARIGPVKIYSREMGHKQLTGRLLSSESRINNRALMTGSLSDEQWEKLGMGTSKISELPILIDDKTAHIDEAIHKAKQDHSKTPLKLAIFDYIQLFKSEGDTREREVGNISGKLKTLAMELNIPVIALSQLNRKVEERPDHKPKLSDLRESGAIEQDSDIVILMHRPDKYEEEKKMHTGITELNIAKHRNGPTGIIKVGFEGKFTKFYNLA